MALSFNIEISDNDIPFFMQAMERAEQRAAGKSAQQILDAASKTLADSKGQDMPAFVRERLAGVGELIAMVRDEGWGLADDEKSRIISALTYFADPEDLIPDNVPVLGYLDDAIMLAIVERVLQPEIEAYEDFCQYRNAEAAHRGENPENLKLARAEWMDGRRRELHERMKQRRKTYAPSVSYSPHFRFT